MQTTVQQSHGDRQRKRGGGDGGKGLGLESGLAGALRQSLNKAGEEQREQESSRAKTPQDRQLLLDCLPESDRATPHISTPLPLYSALL